MMRRGVAALVVALWVPVVATAQPKPGSDFSGKWVLDKAKTAEARGGGGRGRGSGGRGGGLPTATEMVIKQSAREMVIDSVTADSYAFSGNPVPAADGLFRWTAKYALDGKEFPANCPPCDAKGTATWEGGKLKISMKRHLFAGALGYIDTEDVDVYSLTSGVLTLERTVDGVQDKEVRTLVYTRK